MTLKWALPLVQGRGAGLGNELVPWVRAHLIAQAVGAHCLPPAFGLNSRRYWRHFGTPRLDWAAHRALCAALPRVHFGEQDWLAHGGGDVVHAFARFAEQHRLPARSAFALTTDGMWGGMPHIEAGRDFARSVLYQSRFAARNLARIHQRLDPALPVVGIHVRLGDFAAAQPAEAYRGRFNVSLPMAWYRRVALSLQQQLDGQVQFLVVSDAKSSQLGELTNDLRCVFTDDLPDSDCSDLLALSRADLMVCAVSSYSVWAAFLSEAPYLWFEPNLTEAGEGWQGIWAHEPGQKQSSSFMQRALAELRGAEPVSPTRAWSVPMTGEVAPQAIRQMQARRAHRATDLIRYGLVPSASAGEGAR